MPYEPLNLSTDKPVSSWANHELGAAETKMAKNVAKAIVLVLTVQVA